MNKNNATSAINVEEDKPAIISFSDIKDENTTNSDGSVYKYQWILQEGNSYIIKVEPKEEGAAQFPPGIICLIC